MHVVVVYTVLSFCVLYQLKPRANCLWILLQYPLPIFSSIEGYLKLVWTRYEALSLVLAYRLTTLHA
jgi:hypothetical protein